jgi:hypothetical protein
VSRPTGRPGKGATASRLLALALVASLPLAACQESSTSPQEEDTDFQGTWLATDGQLTAYLAITPTTLTQYLSVNDGCFEAFGFEIEGQNGSTLTLRDTETDATVQVTLRKDGDTLHVAVGGQPEGFPYNRTSDDVSELAACVYPDAASIICEDLPAIDAGTPVEGELSTTDSTFGYDGAYYDLYGLELASAGEVEITLTSEAFDTYMVAYDGDGTYVDENDDLSYPDNTNSGLSLELQAGCFRVMVTSYDPGETGAYTLSIN